MSVYQTAQTPWQSAGSREGVAKVLLFAELQNGFSISAQLSPRVEDESSH